MRSGSTEYSAPLSRSTPSTVIVVVPAPPILAPIAARKAAHSLAGHQELLLALVSVALYAAICGNLQVRARALADRANQYIDERKPWLLAKDPQRHAEVVEVCTLGLNCFRSLVILLKPVLPALTAHAETFLGGRELCWQDLHEPLLDAVVRYPVTAG